MNNKPNGLSIIHGLPPEQQAQVEEWLFVENCTYKETAKRCRERLKLAVGVSSVVRYYFREAPQWRAEQMAGVAASARLIRAAAREGGEDTYQAALDLARQTAMEMTLDPEADPGEMARLLKLQIAARREAHEAERLRLEAEWLRLETERVRLDGERTEIARAKFEFDAVTECLEHQTELEEIMADKTKSNPEKIIATREALFGGNLPA